MQRQSILHLLHQYSPKNPEEIHFKQAFIEFINKHPDCFERTLEIGHLTGSAWLLNKDHSKALLMHHAKLDQWFQLGGHCDGDSNVLEVAIKEALEESGLKQIVPVSDMIFDIDIHEIPANKTTKAHLHYDVRFLLQSVGDDEIIPNNESKELRWIGKSRAELPTTNESILRMFEKWQSLHSSK